MPARQRPPTPRRSPRQGVRLRTTALRAQSDARRHRRRRPGRFRLGAAPLCSYCPWPAEPSRRICSWRDMKSTLLIRRHYDNCGSSPRSCWDMNEWVFCTTAWNTQNNEECIARQSQVARTGGPSQRRKLPCQASLSRRKGRLSSLQCLEDVVRQCRQQQSSSTKHQRKARRGLEISRKRQGSRGCRPSCGLRPPARGQRLRRITRRR
mmetsp:Transcript_13829/g.55327  ORF Transcript_13829/g.55327 Transcript_13829/m.55327 type:complete len:208 (+) Transcript_13829:269-892(+)